MNNVFEKEKKQTVSDECDAFVSDGGIAGISAGLYACRRKFKLFFCAREEVILRPFRNDNLKKHNK